MNTKLLQERVLSAARRTARAITKAHRGGESNIRDERNLVQAVKAMDARHDELVCSALTIDSEWTYRRTGETYRLLYWERDFVLIRKVRGLDGLVGQVVKISPAQFRECYTCNLIAAPQPPPRRL